MATRVETPASLAADVIRSSKPIQRSYGPLRVMSPFHLCCVLFVSSVLHAQDRTAVQLEELVRGYLWSEDVGERAAAESALESEASLVGVSRMQMHDLEEILRAGRGGYEMPTAVDGRIAMQSLSVELPGGTQIPVLVSLPPQYSPNRAWPLMFAMHGGPPGRAAGIERSAERMVRIWTEAADQAGWIVAAPGMVTTVSGGGRTQDRLPYEIFHEEDARAVVDALRERFNINPDRVVSTGISLGSNFSIGYAAAHQDWLSAIVPVSTEGDSRELLLRNLTVPTYVLEGALDRNIRGVNGPRAMHQILAGFGYDITYREFGDRAHEGFQEHYSDVLSWLDSRARDVYPREVVRVPHDAIMSVSRRVHWVETDTRQALVRARVSSPNRIDLTVRWARRLHVYLHDRLVDLDQPVQIFINGTEAYAADVPRSMATALRQARALGDERRGYPAVLELAVPQTDGAIAAGRELWQKLQPRREPGPLSFWEMYAQRAIEERFPELGFAGVETEVPGLGGERVGVQIDSVQEGSPFSAAGLRAGDVLIEFGGEPIYRGREALDGMYRWLVRELRGTPRDYTLAVLRDGSRRELTVTLRLGPYKD